MVNYQVRKCILTGERKYDCYMGLTTDKKYISKIVFDAVMFELKTIHFSSVKARKVYKQLIDYNKVIVRTVTWIQCIKLLKKSSSLNSLVDELIVIEQAISVDEFKQYRQPLSKVNHLTVMQLAVKQLLDKYAITDDMIKLVKAKVKANDKSAVLTCRYTRGLVIKPL